MASSRTAARSSAGSVGRGRNRTRDEMIEDNVIQRPGGRRAAASLVQGEGRDRYATGNRALEQGFGGGFGMSQEEADVFRVTGESPSGSPGQLDWYMRNAGGSGRTEIPNPGGTVPFASGVAARAPGGAYGGGGGGAAGAPGGGGPFSGMVNPGGIPAGSNPDAFGGTPGAAAFGNPFGTMLEPGVEVGGRLIDSPRNLEGQLALPVLSQVGSSDYLRALNNPVRNVGVAFGDIGMDTLGRGLDQGAEARAGQMDLARALEAQAAGTGGPSAAERQLQAGADMAAQQAMAMAGAQRGNPFLAARNAQLAGSQAMQAANQEAAQLRATEQLRAQQQLGGLLQGVRAGDQSLQGFGGDLSSFGLGALQQANNFDAQLRQQDIDFGTTLLTGAQSASRDAFNRDMANRQFRRESIGAGLGGVGSLTTGLF